MTDRKTTAPLTTLALCLALSACGGGSTGSGVASTPAGPTYKKLSELTGDQTFQTGGVHFNNSGAGFTNPVVDAFGNGVVVGYGAASDTYTLTVPGTAPVTFFPSEVTSTGTGTNGGTFVNWTKTGTSGTERLNILRPAIGGVQLSYVLLGTWHHTVNGIGTTTYSAAGGVPTVASDMPRTGSANYTTSVLGVVIQPSPTGGAPTSNLLTGAATSTFSANFAAGTVSNTLNLLATNGTNFGTFTGAGTIASGSNGFTGTYAGTTQSAFSGAFFGPQAAEIGMSFQLATGNWNASGQIVGVKQ